MHLISSFIISNTFNAKDHFNCLNHYDSYALQFYLNMLLRKGVTQINCQ